MRILYGYVIAVILLTSCSSSKSLYIQGNYYEAVINSISKLRREPDHETSILTLRQAYPQAVTYYEQSIQNSTTSTVQFKWLGTIESYNKLQSMYDEIRRCPGALKVIPNPTNYFDKLNQARNNAAEEYYAAGVTELSYGARDRAKTAYSHFVKCNEIVPGYKDVRARMEEATWAATLKIMVEPVASAKKHGVSAEGLETRVAQYIQAANKDPFVKVMTAQELKSHNLRADQIVKIQLDQFDPGKPVVQQTQSIAKRDSVAVPGTYVASTNPGIGDDKMKAEKERLERLEAVKEKAEKEKKEKEEKDRLDKEKVEKEKADKEKKEKDEKDRVEKEKIEKEKKDKEEKDRLDKEKSDKEKADKEKKEKDEKDRVEKEKVEKEKKDKEEKDRLEKEKGDKEKIEKEKKDKEEKDRLDKEKSDKEKADKEKKEKDEKDRVEKEKVEKEKKDKEEKDRLEKEKGDKEKIEREKKDKEEKDRLDKEKSDKEKADKEKAEKDRVEKDRVEKEKIEKEKKDKEEKDRLDKEKADKEKADKERADKEEKDRAEKEKVEKEKIEKEKKDKEEKDRLDKEKADQEKTDKEKAGAGGDKEKGGDGDRDKSDKNEEKKVDKQKSGDDDKEDGDKKDGKKNSSSFLILKDPIYFASASNARIYSLIEADTNKVYQPVKATYTHFRKSRASRGVVTLTIVDGKNGAVLLNEKIEGVYNWESQWATVKGDERALSPSQLKISKTKEIAPPNTQEAFNEAMKSIEEKIQARLQSFYK
jgi:hypothetical protein